jgi:hypothetical protein
METERKKNERRKEKREREMKTVMQTETEIERNEDREKDRERDGVRDTERERERERTQTAQSSVSILDRTTERQTPHCHPLHVLCCGIRSETFSYEHCIVQTSAWIFSLPFQILQVPGCQGTGQSGVFLANSSVII